MARMSAIFLMKGKQNDEKQNGGVRSLCVISCEPDPTLLIYAIGTGRAVLVKDKLFNDGVRVVNPHVAEARAMTPPRNPPLRGVTVTIQ